eukprot:jgi/Psemu1/254359/estExt_Genewise1Plus.C_960031
MITYATMLAISVEPRETRQCWRVAGSNGSPLHCSLVDRMFHGLRNRREPSGDQQILSTALTHLKEVSMFELNCACHWQSHPSGLSKLARSHCQQPVLFSQSSWSVSKNIGALFIVSKHDSLYPSYEKPKNYSSLRSATVAREQRQACCRRLFGYHH